MTALSFDEELSQAQTLPARFHGHLAGMYGWGSDEDVYARLPEDKRAALLLIERRLTEKNLWRAVGKIVNVYGVGGVGLYFDGLIDLETELAARGDFTRWFARHADNSGGFLERGRRHASLHFLYIDKLPAPREWHVHLDLYGPMGSWLTTSKHLLHERWRKFRPDWRMMKEFVK